MCCVPAELAALLGVDPRWQAPASSGRDAPPARREDLHLLARLPDPQPRWAAPPEVALQAVAMAVVGKHKLEHSWGGRSLPPPPANQDQIV